MASDNSYNARRVSPPPPHLPPPPPHLPPPPPHLPLPPPSPPSPSPDSNPAVIVIVFISLGGGLFFLAFVAAVLCCFMKKIKTKTTQDQQTAGLIHVEGHRKVREAVAPGPDGREAVVVTIEDDVHIDKMVKKKKEQKPWVGHGSLQHDDDDDHSATVDQEPHHASSSNHSNVLDDHHRS